MNLNRRQLLQYFSAITAATVAGPHFARAAATGELRIGLSTYPAHFRPWMNVGYAGQLVSTLINRALLSYDETGVLVGELAESWERDGETGWKFTLRDAKFSNGDPVTAEDVKWTLEQIAAEGSGAYMRDPVLGIAEVEVIDSKNFRLVTKAPMATIPAVMAYPFLGILQAGSTDAAESGIGAGPYTIGYAEKGVTIELDANPAYFKDGLPKIRKVTITPYADESLRVAALKAADVDLIDYVPWSQMDSIKADAGLALNSVPNGAFMFLSFNGSGVFKDSRVRQAVAFALRREDFVKSVFYGHGAPLAGVPRPTVSPYHNEDLANYWSYNPEKAKALLKEAGFENGLKVSLLATSQYTMHRDCAVLVQNQLKDIGIDVELLLPDWATRVTMGNRGQGDFAIQGIGLDSLDPDAVTTLVDPALPPVFTRSRNFEVPELTALLARGRSEFDETARIAIYAEADRVACDAATFTGLCYRATGFATSSAVSGLKMLPDQLSPFSATLFDQLTIS